MKTNRDESASLWDEVLALRRVNAELVGALRALLPSYASDGLRTIAHEPFKRRLEAARQTLRAALAKAAGTEP